MGTIRRLSYNIKMDQINFNYILLLYSLHIDMF